MVTFDCMKKIKKEKPPIVSSETFDGYIYEYSNYCFVKNKYGYTIARYVKCEKQNLEYWGDPGIEQLTKKDKWCLLKDVPHLYIIQKILEYETRTINNSH